MVGLQATTTTAAQLVAQERGAELLEVGLRSGGDERDGHHPRLIGALQAGQPLIGCVPLGRVLSGPKHAERLLRLSTRVHRVCDWPSVGPASAEGAH